MRTHLIAEALDEFAVAAAGAAEPMGESLPAGG